MSNIIYRLAAGVVIALILASCASSYGKASLTGGFEEQRVGETDWRIAYYSNAYTSEETVQSYWLHRAAELTVQSGYDGFRIPSQVELMAGRASDAASAHAIYRVGRDPVAEVSIVERGVLGDRPYMVATIRMLRYPLPDEPRRVFDAKAMLAFLGPYVKGTLCETNVCPHVHRYLFPNFNPPPPSPAPPAPPADKS